MTLTSNKVPQREHNEDRVRRAKSWLERSKICACERQKAANPQDETGLYCEQFIFLWIAFNAAYGQEPFGAQTTVKERKKPRERDKFKLFLSRIVQLDGDKIIHRALRGEHSGPVGALIENKWVFCGFWDCVRGRLSDKGWKKIFEEENDTYDKYRYLRNHDVSDVADILGIVFGRLYQLRNQILHGGTTFAGTWGRPQIKQGCEIMASLVPAIIDIMESDIDKDPDSKIWGDVAYPRSIERKDWT